LIALKRTDYLARSEKNELLLIALKRTDYLARSEKSKLLLIALNRTDYLARFDLLLVILTKCLKLQMKNVPRKNILVVLKRTNCFLSL